MIEHTSVSRGRLRGLIRRRTLRLAGHSGHRIYGRLSCRAGMRMKRENRVFFIDEAEARAAEYRPCGNCMPDEYGIWKSRDME